MQRTLSLVSLVPLVRRTLDTYSAVRGGQLAAALAYHALFSLAPLLVLAVAAAGSVLGEQAAAGGLQSELEAAIGKDTASLVVQMVASAEETQGAAYGLGVVLAIYTGSNLFFQAEVGLRAVFGVANSAVSGWRGYLRRRGMAMMAALGPALVLLVSLAAGGALSVVGRRMENVGLGRMIGWGSQLVVWVLATGMVALGYRYLTPARLPWRAIWRGSAFAAFGAGFATLSIVAYFELVAGRGAFAAVGGVAVVLFLGFLLAQLFLLGAALARALSEDSVARAV